MIVKVRDEAGTVVTREELNVNTTSYSLKKTLKLNTVYWYSISYNGVECPEYNFTSNAGLVFGRDRSQYDAGFEASMDGWEVRRE